MKILFLASYLLVLSFSLVQNTPLATKVHLDMIK